MTKPRARIRGQVNLLDTTELSIRFDTPRGPDPFAELPELLLDVPHETFRHGGGRKPRRPVRTYWLARSWGDA